MTMRLDKYLANLGVSSRRDVESVLNSRMLTVNGKRIKAHGARIDPEKDTILLDGNPLQQPKLIYFLLNKPKGIISTADDEFGRKNVLSLVKTRERMYPVGRLDKETSGLILLTNDGELTNLLTHPRYHVPKIYQLTIVGKATERQLHQLRSGVRLTDGMTSPAEVTVLNEGIKRSMLEVKIFEGRNRQIRRMCEAVKIHLLDLKRIAFGPLTIGDLKEGQSRELSAAELQLLQKATPHT